MSVQSALAETFRSWLLLLLVSAAGLWAVGRDLAAGLVARSAGLPGALSWASAAQAAARRATEPRPPILHLVSHRSCDVEVLPSCPKQGFSKALQRIETQADMVPIVGARHMFHDLPPVILNDPKWAQHLKMARGRGYWFWKPALLNLLLDNKTILDGDAVVWLDGDTGLGKQAEWERAMEFTWSEEGFDLLVNAQPACEWNWTKGDTWEKFGLSWNDPQYGPQVQPKANRMLLKINAKTRRFLKMWEDLVADYHLVSDEKSISPNPPGFKENRHDQSLMSMLLKASMVYTAPCGKRSLNRPWTPKLHPVYGIEGFKGKMGTVPGTAHRSKKR